MRRTTIKELLHLIKTPYVTSIYAKNSLKYINMKVHITRPIPQNGIDLLKKEGIEVVLNQENILPSKEQIIERSKECEGLLPILTDTIDAELMDALPKLKIIANYAVGFNNIDIKAATERGIIVTNTPGVLNDTTADFAFTLMMAAGRHIIAADKFSREGKFDKWEPIGFLGQDIYKATLGIVGAGRIGTAMAKRAIGGFEMNVIYFDPKENETLNKLGAKKVEMDELLAESDFVSIHVPLFESTKHLINAEALKKMKKSAFIINTARGPVINEQDLVDALKTGEIRGAGLDVYENEPTIHPDLLQMDNVVLAPHIASASIGTRGAMARIAAENLIAFSKGENPITPVNPQVMENTQQRTINQKKTVGPRQAIHN
jgi:glyoxylate reductase